MSNDFDGDRYEFAGSSEAVSVQGSNSEFISKENTIKADFDNWTVSGNKATYKNSFSVAKGGATLKYIQFRVKDNEMLRILDNPNEGVQESRPTTASTDAYHKYKRKEYSSEKGKYEDVTHTTPSVTKHDDAPYLKFKLGKERVVTGTVFEDRIDNSRPEEVVGNGRYEKDNESAVQDVIVELVTELNGEPIDVYIASEDKKTYTIQKARTTTKSDGEEKGKFEIYGVMPGDYFIRLTYGDGTQKIMNSDGTVVSIDDYIGSG